MALIFRSIFSADLPSGVADVAAATEAWIEAKVPAFSPGAGSGTQDFPDAEITSAEVGTAGGWPRAVQFGLFEKKPPGALGQEIKTTVSAWQLTEGAPTTVWVDLRRWLEQVEARLWVPDAPRVVRAVLDAAPSLAAHYGLASTVASAEPDDVRGLLDVLTSSVRQHPVTLVTRDSRCGEPWSDVERRAATLQVSVTGISRVVILREGAVSAFSEQALQRLGPGYDVHSGAIRTYLPGLGLGGDSSYRHPFVQGRRIIGKPKDVLRTVVAGPMHRRAAEVSSPREWRDLIRPLLPLERDMGEWVAELEAENEDLNGQIEMLTARIAAIEPRLDEAEQENELYLREVDRLTRQARYLESLQPRGSTPDQRGDDAGIADTMDLPSEAVQRARNELSLVVLPGEVDDATERLDDQAENGTWARKAWQALYALNLYARAKESGAFSGGFREFVDRGEAGIPAGWVAMHESETTRNDPIYRGLRTLPVDQAVDPTGRIFMEAHIKLQQGGSPCPRIHFWDDTSGSTGRVHIGYFGDHLDNASKS